MKNKSRKPVPARKSKTKTKTKSKVQTKSKTVVKVKKNKKQKTRSPKPVVKKNKTRVEEIKETLVSGKVPTDIGLLEQLFGGALKMQLWKIFCLNPNKEFTLRQLIRMTRTKADRLIPDLKEMMKQAIIIGSRKALVTNDMQKEMNLVYRINLECPLRKAITNMILDAIPRSSERVIEQVQSLPRLKTVLLSGFFVDAFNAQSPIDMILIFDKVPGQVADTVSELERDLGRDLQYAALDEEDFKYRHSIGDRLIRDVLDFDHIVAMDKMGFFK